LARFPGPQLREDAIGIGETSRGALQDFNRRFSEHDTKLAARVRVQSKQQ